MRILEIHGSMNFASCNIFRLLCLTIMYDIKVFLYKTLFSMHNNDNSSKHSLFNFYSYSNAY